MHGIRSSISAIAVHPTKSLLAIAGAEGFIILYDYMQKEQKLHQYEAYTKEAREKKVEAAPTQDKGGKGKKGEDAGAVEKKEEKEKSRHKVFTCLEFTP